MTATVEIRSGSDADLAALVAVLGQRHYFTDHLARQQDSRGVVLVALTGVAIAHRRLQSVGLEDSAMIGTTGAIPERTSAGGQTRVIPWIHDRVGSAECRSSP